MEFRYMRSYMRFAGSWYSIMTLFTLYNIYRLTRARGCACAHVLRETHRIKIRAARLFLAKSLRRELLGCDYSVATAALLTMTFCVRAVMPGHDVEAARPGDLFVSVPFNAVVLVTWGLISVQPPLLPHFHSRRRRLLDKYGPTAAGLRRSYVETLASIEGFRSGRHRVSHLGAGSLDFVPSFLRICDKSGLQAYPVRRTVQRAYFSDPVGLDCRRRCNFVLFSYRDRRCRMGYATADFPQQEHPLPFHIVSVGRMPSSHFSRFVLHPT